MNNLRDILNNNLQNLEDDLDILFDQFVDEVNDIPFTIYSENDPSFQLNQRVVNNIYLLRRSLDLDRHQLRRQLLAPEIMYNSPPTNTPIEQNIEERPRNFIYSRRNAITPENDSLWVTDFSRRITDNLLNSFFTNFNDFVEEQFQNYNDLEDVKVTLSEDEFNKLESTVDESLLQDNLSCNICLEEINKEDSLIKLKCNHIYHKNCIKEWLTKQSTKCPNCRFCCREPVEKKNS